MIWVLLASVGLFVGGFGAMIGAAGGFILVPILLFLYPDETPATITSITLTIAFFNSVSGSIAYTRLRRTDFRSGLVFSAAAIPGATIGASITSLLARGAFEMLFGSVLLLAAIYLMIRPMHTAKSVPPSRGNVMRKLTDIQGNAYSYSYSRTWGIACAFGVGVLSGLLGIGGGIIHVPLLTQVLTFPVHVATATSQLVVASSTLAASITHLVSGSFSRAAETAVICGGAIAGAQLGARLSSRVPGPTIVRLLAGALAVVAIRVLLQAM